jgi:hypothetical protein
MSLTLSALLMINAPLMSTQTAQLGGAMDLNRGERLQIMLTQDEVKALDDWRFARRMPSRASAIRELLRVGLAAEGVEVAAAGVRSKDFGVVAAMQKTVGRNARSKNGG